VITGGGGLPPVLPAPLVGLTSPSPMVPLISKVDGDEIVFPGASARLKVHLHYTGPRTVHYQWQRATGENDWVNLSAGNESELVIHAIGHEDAGLFRVMADAGCAQGVSEPVQLQVLELPPFSDPTVTGTGAFRFIFSAEPAYNYAIDASSDLKEWTSLIIITNPAGPLEIIDSEASEHPQRFYRATVLVP
jgi:hypothetical protein